MTTDRATKIVELVRNCYLDYPDIFEALTMAIKLLQDNQTKAVEYLGNGSSQTNTLNGMYNTSTKVYYEKQ